MPVSLQRWPIRCIPVEPSYIEEYVDDTSVPYSYTVVKFSHFTYPCYVGGHINPAVTLALAVVGRLKWIKVPIYWLAQYLGAFFGAACVYLVYYGLLLVFIALFLYDR